MTKTIYTIGHSNSTTEHLLELLGQQGVTAIADVRSQPYSRFNPQFNREALASALKNSGLDYVFLGQELGARSEDPACYREGRGVDFGRRATAGGGGGRGWCVCGEGECAPRDAGGREGASQLSPDDPD